ncbi:MAG: hypothetical protein OEZ59_11255 [Deltaproteobacteria bacterium]|nr:hypothetical protein [Deltaproteobacteria bacterium]
MEPIQKLHYDVMGVGLAVRGIQGKSPLFRFIDRALITQNQTELETIWRAFTTLDAAHQRQIIDGTGDQGTMSYCLKHIEKFLGVEISTIEDSVSTQRSA